MLVATRPGFSRLAVAELQVVDGEERLFTEILVRRGREHDGKWLDPCCERSPWSDRSDEDK